MDPQNHPDQDWYNVFREYQIDDGEVRNYDDIQEEMDIIYGAESEDDFYNEYNDLDATSCACGDYNAFEENQVFLDREWE